MRESEGEIVMAELVGAKSPLNRAYSMADPPSSDGQLTLVFDRVKDGIGSNYLYGLKLGNELRLADPYGNFILLLSLDQDLPFISRYTGLVPIRWLYVERAGGIRASQHSILIAVGPTEDEWLYLDELLALAVRHPSFRYLPVAINGMDQEVVATAKLLRPHITGKPKVTPLLSKEFVRSLRAYFMETGYDRKEVKIETYINVLLSPGSC